VWRKPAAAALAVLMLLVGPAAVGVVVGVTPTEPGWPASPPTGQPIPPGALPGSGQLAPSGVGCPRPQAATVDPDLVGICDPAGPAATPAVTPAVTPSPVTSTTTPDEGPYFCGDNSRADGAMTASPALEPLWIAYPRTPMQIRRPCLRPRWHAAVLATVAFSGPLWGLWGWLGNGSGPAGHAMVVTGTVVGSAGLLSGRALLRWDKLLNGFSLLLDATQVRWTEGSARLHRLDQHRLPDHRRPTTAAAAMDHPPGPLATQPGPIVVDQRHHAVPAAGGPGTGPAAAAPERQRGRPARRDPRRLRRHLPHHSRRTD